jgi:hypothetical protein
MFMTDNEIIKALECCAIKHLCNECPLNHNRKDCIRIERLVLDLIERQKAEIERLENHIQEGVDLAKQLPEMVAFIQAEAYKEFAERLKERKYQSSDWSHGEHPFVVEEDDIDEVLEEMVGAEDAD